jgi:glutathione synthase/RimK-type ligase-like ATP-grasp enzyme
MWILRRRGGITAKKLASFIGCYCKKETLPYYRHFIINYGNNYNRANLNKNVIFDKLRTQRILETNGILMPKIYMKGETIPDEAFPLLARKKYHSQGRDIIYIANRRHLGTIPTYKYDFLTEYINKKSEYRVHILGNYTSIVNVKYDSNGRADPIVRNKYNGWKQISYMGDYERALVELSKKVLNVLGYDFGAVDIIRKKDKLYVLEINSAPGLENRKLEMYAKYFKEEERKWKLNM